MQTKVVEQTSEKLILKVKISLSFAGLFMCFMGLAVSLIGGLGILDSIRQLFFNPSFIIIYLQVLIVSFALFLLGIFMALVAILYFLIDTTCIFDRNLRKLTIKNSKYLRGKLHPYEYSFDEIADITTVLTTVSESRLDSYDISKLSIVLTSNEVIVISEAKQSPRNQEKYLEIVNLIRRYLN